MALELVAYLKVVNLFRNSIDFLYGHVAVIFIALKFSLFLEITF